MVEHQDRDVVGEGTVVVLLVDAVLLDAVVDGRVHVSVVGEIVVTDAGPVSENHVISQSLVPSDARYCEIETDWR